MRRTLLVAGILPFVSAFLGGWLAFSLAVPGLVAAQDIRLRAAQFTAEGPDGEDRVRIQAGPQVAASVAILNPAGVPRVNLASGGNGTNPGAVGLNLFADDGVQIVRLGSGGTQAGAEPGSVLFLRDTEGRDRIRQVVAPDGTPSISLLDVEGNVIWSAP